MPPNMYKKNRRGLVKAPYQGLNTIRATGISSGYFITTHTYGKELEATVAGMATIVQNDLRSFFMSNNKLHRYTLISSKLHPIITK